MPTAFQIGQIPVEGRILLAPLDGISDQPFRWICRRLGSALSYSEFINVRDVPKGLNDFSKRAAFTAFERPFGFQLYGSDPEKIREAAALLKDKEPDFFDLNLGCSVRRIAGRGAGAGLLKNPRKIRKIMSNLKTITSIPVTAKIRLGWDADNLNYLEVAGMLEDAGCAAIAVHGRIRSDLYSIPAQWEPIQEIKESVSIPVIGNGDVLSPSDAARMLSSTGCDAVMVGRAAVGNPWIFSGLNKTDLTREEILEIVKLHWQLMIAFYGVERSRFLFKKHLKAYLSTAQFQELDLSALISHSNPMNQELLFHL